ncbi:hypothetical protein AMTRI_Chr05g58400 [Amborella trichopoda]|uniref:DUF4005 domain-containing protein n=1 Tax=Amborella trichopoda TaxID=13333 RepID=U5D4B9_AMBTC|nr:protein IQ-DOMAIN 14 [Amborella trichopoda]ERN15198.1 hypothetical protein AMTR_s00056p00168250 [Amborella trichopoda]|eukprot:XP_006853731.1 protein IQ-DOMAIN 14 [Amborella trichopoda]
MGRATRWLKSLFGVGKKEQKDQTDRKDKKRWGFARDPPQDYQIPAKQGQIPVPPNEIPSMGADTWLRSYRDAYYNEREKEQNKHAIAVAAATAAAADAAVAAAQAAVAVVRLTSHGRGTMFSGGVAGSRERWAAVKIQTVFRGYLAKKALRALKGLVKLQALVRGYLVRRQAAATLHSMQALIRAQATVRTQRAHRSLQTEPTRPRKSIERHEEPSFHHSRRLSASTEPAFSLDVIETPKIVEIDTCRPRTSDTCCPSRVSDTSRPRTSDSWRRGPPPLRPTRKRNPSISDSTSNFDQSFSSAPTELAWMEPGHALSSPLGSYYEPDWTMGSNLLAPNLDECRFSTAQSTPRFSISVRAPNTPTKSTCGEMSCHYSGSKGYMADTQSFRAKLRSHSAPKQRPEGGLGFGRKRYSIGGEEGRSSLSGARMQRSCSHVQEAFRSTVVTRLERVGFGREQGQQCGHW